MGRAKHTNKYPYRKRTKRTICLNKKLFVSKEEAERFARERHFRQRAYYCEVCMCYHLTTSKGRRR